LKKVTCCAHVAIVVYSPVFFKIMTLLRKLLPVCINIWAKKNNRFGRLKGKHFVTFFSFTLNRSTLEREGLGASFDHWTILLTKLIFSSNTKKKTTFSPFSSAKASFYFSLTKEVCILCWATMLVTVTGTMGRVKNAKFRSRLLLHTNR